jgi:hypothetical protein
VTSRAAPYSSLILFRPRECEIVGVLVFRRVRGHRNRRKIAVGAAIPAAGANILFMQRTFAFDWLDLVLEIWAGLFGLPQARPKNRNPKHGPTRNNMSRASTARRRAWAMPQIPACRAPDTARIDGSGLGRHGPIKPNMFNFFNLVRYRLYIGVIFRVYVVK